MNLDELDSAYRDTDYHVLLENRETVVRIGERSFDLEKELALSGSVTWAFITPCNPRSASLDQQENQTRLEEFRREVSDKYELRKGFGLGRQGDWPAEPSFLIIGIAKPDALVLATMWEQNAFVFGSVDSVAELVWCPQVCGFDGDGAPI